MKLFRVIVTMPVLPGKRKSWRHEFIAMGKDRDEAIYNAKEAYPAWFVNITGDNVTTETCEGGAAKIKTFMVKPWRQL